jgi:UTP--glucose-1-phosphate uridylyltransferase
MKKIRKAVFPVAGLGTRFLPATKAMPKELLPIIDKPLIQYAAEEAVSAGIDTLVFVTGKNKRAIEDHFDSNFEIELALKKRGLYEQADMIKNILPSNVECIFVRQSEQLGLGHAVLCAERVIGDDPFAVLLADDFLIHDNLGVMHDLVNAYEKSSKSQLSLMEINGPEISKYGVALKKKNSKSVIGIVEKPVEKEAPSNMASIGRYILTPDIFNHLKNQKPGLGGEIQLTDSINIMASQGNVESVLLNGKRYDCGSIKGYVDAIVYMADKIYC